jgi:hypothetical protein
MTRALLIDHDAHHEGTKTHETHETANCTRDSRSAAIEFAGQPQRRRGTEDSTTAERHLTQAVLPALVVVEVCGNASHVGRLCRPSDAAACGGVRRTSLCIRGCVAVFFVRFALVF